MGHSLDLQLVRELVESPVVESRTQEATMRLHAEGLRLTGGDRAMDAASNGIVHDFFEGDSKPMRALLELLRQIVIKRESRSHDFMIGCLSFDVKMPIIIDALMSHRRSGSPRHSFWSMGRSPIPARTRKLELITAV